MKRPQGAESVLNDRGTNRAKVPTVEAPAIKVRDDPKASSWDDVFAVRPRGKHSSPMIFEVGSAVWDEFSIDLNAMRCDLHVVAGDGGDWLHQW